MMFTYGSTFSFVWERNELFIFSSFMVALEDNVSSFKVLKLLNHQIERTYCAMRSKAGFQGHKILELCRMILSEEAPFDERDCSGA